MCAMKKPNVIYILVDNWGWADLQIQGGSIPTPRMNALANEGLRLTNFNVESQCTPTRSAILTGRLPIRSGTHKVTYGLPYGLTPWEYTLAQLLSDAGYGTALFGKWHLGDVEGRLPTDQGFDQWFGIKNTSDEAGYSSTPQFDPEVMPQPNIWEGRKGEPSHPIRPFNLESRKTIDREIVERSERYIAEQAKSGNPFFLYIGMTQIHPPLGHHPDFDNATGTGIYGDIVTELDYNVGRIADALDAAGISEDTIVILTGDNGAVTEGIGGGSNGPWRGGFTGYEAGLRTVGMIRWPARIEAGRVSDEIFAALDWMPTIAGMIGESERIPDDRPIDGLDQSAFVLGGQEESRREHVLYFIGEDLFAVKWRTFKIHLKTAETMWSPLQEHMFPPVYDVRNDPGEDNDLMKQSLFAYSWVYSPMNKILGELGKSIHTYPNIKPGQEFDGYT
ncbi:MAG: sulfatase-like hydrolase/transferase [Hyphomicrobiales bacterium]|nr:sulfatase-like hydrolase/transferase [Hyphomicrobiales bacterium]